MTTETWKDIPGYEGRYQVSDLCRVKSLGRMFWSGKTNYYKSDRIIKVSKNSKGYQQFTVSKNGISKSIKLHRILAELFIPKVDGKIFVNHKDGNKVNNNLENLEWCTHKENLKHAYDNGLLSVDKRIDNLKKFNIKRMKPVIEVNSKKIYSSTSEAARHLNLDITMIGRVCKGIYKQYKGYRFKYFEEDYDGNKN